MRTTTCRDPALSPGQPRRWRPDFRNCGPLIFTLLRRATVDESPLFGEEPYWWIQERERLRRVMYDPRWYKESTILDSSDLYVPPEPGQLRLFPGSRPFMLVELSDGPVKTWTTIGPDGISRYVYPIDVEELSELVAP